MGNASRPRVAVPAKHPISEGRKTIFLKVLSETGSPIAAAAAATPWSTHRQGGITTFRDLARRDLINDNYFSRSATVIFPVFSLI